MPFDGTYQASTRVLITAHERIVSGWSPKNERSREGVCLAVALSEAALAEAVDFPTVYRFVRPFLGISGPEGISTWNDAEGRTKEEVLEVLDRAALASVSCAVILHSPTVDAWEVNPLVGSEIG